MSQFEHFSLREAYSFAAHVRAEIFDQPDNGWLNYFTDAFAIDADFERRALAPRRGTLLHLAIETVVSNSIEYDCDKGYPAVSAQWLLDSFESHSVEMPSRHRSRATKLAEGQDEDFQATLDELQGLHSRVCEPRIVAEVFTLLFGDRVFLLRFNERVADEVVSVATMRDHPDLLAKDGVVKRFKQWPAWLKRALVYRDKGRCAICLTDLSGLLAVRESAAHIDHMVPLEGGGTNDPTNLQLLCEKCNRTKDTHAKTAHRYMVYW
jgi:hypothetical protein